MARTKVEREAEQLLAIAPVLPKWRRAKAAYLAALAELEAGGDDWAKARRAHDRLLKVIGEAAGYAPGSYRDPAIADLNAELDALPKIAAAQERGRLARQKSGEAEMKRLREAEREAKRPYEWIYRTK